MAETTHPELPPMLRQANNLPSLPAVALEVLRLTQDEEATANDLADAIGRDPALAAKLLKLSNSSLFNVGQEITTLQRATMVLGMKTVKLMALSFSLVGSLPKSVKGVEFDLGEFWRRSLVGAVSGRSIAKLVRSADGDEVFLCGLLGHLGRLVIAQCCPEEYGAALAEDGGWPSLEVEERVLGFHNADVAVALLRHWELPELVHQGVGYAARPESLPADAPERVSRMVRLLAIARLTETVLCDERKGDALQALFARGKQDFDLSEEEIEAFLIGLESGISDTADMLSVRIPEGTSHAELVDRARLQMVDVSLGTAVDLTRMRRRAEALEEANRELDSRAYTDRLTGLPNRAAFDDFLGGQVQSRLEGKLPRALGLVLVDVDHFKRFNDTYGHQVGDEVLRMIGSILRRMTRKGDLPARYGGEEFVVVAPQTTPFGLKTMAERLRGAIEAEILEIDGQKLSVTASFGGACIANVEGPRDGEALVKLADRFLYRAKEAGRNRCEVYSKVHLPGRTS